MHIVEEDLGEARVAIKLRNGSHGDARCIERHKDERESFVARGLRIGAENSEAPVGPRCAAGPDLLAVDDPFAAVVAERRFAADAGHVAAGIRLAPGLSPDLVALGHRWQEAGLLLGRADLDDGWAQQENAVLAHSAGSATAPILFFEDQPFHIVGVTSAVLNRPTNSRPATLVELGFPLPVQFEAFGGVETW